MIKTKKGNVKAIGKGHELCSDFSVITRALYQDFKEELGEELAKKKLRHAFELGLKTDEELEQEVKERVFGLLKGVVDSMNEDLKGEKEHEELD